MSFSKSLKSKATDAQVRQHTATGCFRVQSRAIIFIHVSVAPRCAPRVVLVRQRAFTGWTSALVLSCLWDGLSSEREKKREKTKRSDTSREIEGGRERSSTSHLTSMSGTIKHDRFAQSQVHWDSTASYFTYQPTHLRRTEQPDLQAP